MENKFFSENLSLPSREPVIHAPAQVDQLPLGPARFTRPRRVWMGPAALWVKFPTGRTSTIFVK
jgi:hypothetical protein